jgi:hypothetical protein
VTESSWFGGETMGAPVAEGVPVMAKELWVVSHEYLLNGSPVPCNPSMHA